MWILRKTELIAGLSDHHRQVFCWTDAVFVVLGHRSTRLFRRLISWLNDGYIHTCRELLLTIGIKSQVSIVKWWTSILNDGYPLYGISNHAYARLFAFGFPCIFALCYTCYIDSSCPNHVEFNLKAASFDKLAVVSLAATKWYIYLCIHMELFICLYVLLMYTCMYISWK